MALEISDLFIFSDVTPETASRADTECAHWYLSWLPEIPLTREQAVNGMVLDETLSDPALADVTAAMEIAAHRARLLGLTLVDVIIRLSTRILEREPAHGAHYPLPTP